MQLYVCYGTFEVHDGHPCRNAHRALTAVGHRPQVVRTGGCFRSDPLWPGRRKVKRLTGNYKVPTLRLDDGTIIDGSENIVAWAAENPSPERQPQ
jgi:hypothetical protein